MVGVPRAEAPAFKRLLRATGVDPGNAFFVRSPFYADYEKVKGTNEWCNFRVDVRETVATCEIETQGYFEPDSPAFICVRVRPATPGVSFPTSCIISLSTSSQRMDELAVQDIVLKEWNMNSAKFSHAGWMETTIPVKTAYHIACLIGKEPTDATRVFLTLRFVGCCDMSNTHRISAVEILYTSFRPRVPPTQRRSSINLECTPEAAIGVGAGLKTVEVELTLSPTPLRDDDRFSEGVFSEYTSRSPLLIQHFQERVLTLDKEFLESEGTLPVLLRKTPLWPQPSSPDSNKNVSCDSSEDCVLAEYVGHTATFSPPRRSVTRPRHTMYADAEDDSSSDVVEVRASPCMMPSNSSLLQCLHGTTMLDSDVISYAPVLTSPTTTPNGVQFDEETGLQREFPIPPQSTLCSTNVTGTTNTTRATTLERDVFSVERSWDQHREKLVSATVEDNGHGPIRMASSSPFLGQRSLIVPDRRDFVPVSSLQRPQQNGAYSHLGEWSAYTTTTCRVGVVEVDAAIVEESRRRIRSLRDVPVYEEQQDLLKTVTELLGVERTSLCKGSFSCTSSSVPSRVVSTEPSVTVPQRSPSPCRTGGTSKDTRQRLVSVEVQESHLAASEPAPTPTATPTTFDMAKLPEAAKQNQKNKEGVSQISTNRVFRLPPTTELGATETKMGISPLNQYSDALPKPTPPQVEIPRPLKYVKSRHVAREALADRTSEINLQDSSVTSGEKCRTWKRPAISVMGPCPYVTTLIPSSEESDEPSLVVQVEDASSTSVPAYWGNSIDVTPTHKGESLTITTPFMGTFLVWKHHVSRNGIAKRILSLQREEDTVLLSFKKLDSSNKVSQVRLREGVEFITGLRAYHSNAIHKSRVHMAEGCLVVTCDGRQVAAVEMQSVSELQLAVQILRPLDPTGPA